MSTSSSDRCTRISPSAVLDDRLHGKDLEWARDHLRRCESCRGRVEDFREMMMRVGRLPSAPIGAAAMDEALNAAIPERIRAAAGAARPFEIQRLPVELAPEPILDLPPQPVRPEVTNARDLLSDLEREIFRDEPSQDHPTAMPPAVTPVSADLGPPPATPVEEEVALPDSDQVESPWLVPPAFPALLGSDLHEVSIDSRQPSAQPPHDEVPPQPETPNESVVDEQPVPAEDPIAEADRVAAPPARRPDTVMRVAVGLGAAACVLLAAFLYEGGLLSRGAHKPSAVVPRATATARALPAASAPPSTSAAPSAAPAAPVLFRLGAGATGGTVFRIRPGTAIAGYTRLVFDIRGGLPAMVITQPDAMHVSIDFTGTTGAAVPVKGIRSFQVAAVEPGVQQGPDLVITIDLARPDRVTAFTLPAAGAYASRLVVDLHTS